MTPPVEPPVIAPPVVGGNPNNGNNGNDKEVGNAGVTPPVVQPPVVTPELPPVVQLPVVTPEFPPVVQLPVVTPEQPPVEISIPSADIRPVLPLTVAQVENDLSTAEAISNANRLGSNITLASLGDRADSDLEGIFQSETEEGTFFALVGSAKPKRGAGQIEIIDCGINLKLFNEVEEEEDRCNAK